MQWTAFNYLQKGATLIFNGQEVQAERVPELFEKDPINWNEDKDISDYMSHLVQLQKDYIPVSNDRYYLIADDTLDTVQLCFDKKDRTIIGVFNLKEHTGEVDVEMTDGSYTNLISKESGTINNGKLTSKHTPALFEIKK